MILGGEPYVAVLEWTWRGNLQKQCVTIKTTTIPAPAALQAPGSGGAKLIRDVKIAMLHNVHDI